MVEYSLLKLDLQFLCTLFSMLRLKLMIFSNYVPVNVSIKNLKKTEECCLTDLLYITHKNYKCCILHSHGHTHIHIHTHIYTNIHAYIHTNIYTYTFTNIHIYIHTYIMHHTHTHTYTFSSHFQWGPLIKNLNI